MNISPAQDYKQQIMSTIKNPVIQKISKKGKKVTIFPDFPKLVVFFIDLQNFELIVAHY